MHGIKYLTNWLTNAYQELFCKNATGSIKADTNHIIERSVLAANLDRIDPFTVGQRRRYATCSGIAWLNHDHLAEVNYYGKHLRIYRVTTGHSSGKPSLTILHELKNLPCFPEQVACSPDGSMLAITLTMTQGDFGVSLYRIDSKDYTPHVMNPVLRKGNAFHGICFSLDSCHLVFTHVQKPGYTECVDLHTGATTFRFENRNFPLVQKGVAFSYDNRYLAIVSARNIHPKSQEGDFPFLVSVYRYHGQEGRIDELPVAEYTCSLHEFNSAEDCTFFPAQKSGIYQLLVVDQANDQVLDFKFDESQRSITYEGIFTLDVSFPHGIAFSPDGCLLAIANYGGDALRIFKYPAGQGSR